MEMTVGRAAVEAVETEEELTLVTSSDYEFWRRLYYHAFSQRWSIGIQARFWL